MPATPKFQIPYPDGTTALTPLQSHFSAIADGVENALNTGLGGAPRIANSDDERATQFPAPVQGNLCVRPDKGYTERYYGTYSSASNPSGATPAGWYPEGADIRLDITRSSWTTTTAATSQALFPTGMSAPRNDGFTIAADGVITLPLIGDYEVLLTHEWVTGNTSGQRNLGLDGTVTILSGRTVIQPPSSIGGIGQTNWYHVKSPAGSTGTVRPFIVHNSGAALVVGSAGAIKYLGRSK